MDAQTLLDTVIEAEAEAEADREGCASIEEVTAEMLALIDELACEERDHASED